MPNRGPLKALGLAAGLAVFSTQADAQFFGLIQQLQQQKQQAQQKQQDAAAKEQPKINPQLMAPAQEFAANRPEKLRPLFERLYYEGEWNAVLNANRLGLAAMAIGEWQIAEKAFDEATGRINAVFADDPNSVNARKYWSEEKIKDFKGDIHERAMSFYYRGLLFLREGDYQNASASFRAADFQDTLSAAEQYQGDFALMNYLASWSNWCDGNETFAKDLQQRAYSVVDGPGKGEFFTQIQAQQDMPNYLVLTEFGRAPEKVGEGRFRELLKYKSRTDAPQFPLMTLVADPQAFRRIAQGISADVEYQATTRGGRQMDAVLGEKAQFKDNMESASKASGAVAGVALDAAMLTGNRDMMGIGAVAGLFALGTSAAAGSTTPAADLREWDTLPRYIGIDAGIIAAAPAGGAVAMNLAKPMLKPAQGETAAAAPLMSGGKGKCGFSWTVQGGLPLPATAGGYLELQNPRMMEEGREAKNKVFRSMLYDRFGAGEKTQ